MAYKQPLHLCVVACVSTTTHRQIYRKVDKTLYQQAYADYSANHTQVSRTNRAIVNKQRVPAKWLHIIIVGIHAIVSCPGNMRMLPMDKSPFAT